MVLRRTFTCDTDFMKEKKFINNRKDTTLKTETGSDQKYMVEVFTNTFFVRVRNFFAAGWFGVRSFVASNKFECCIKFKNKTLLEN